MINIQRCAGWTQWCTVLIAPRQRAIEPLGWRLRLYYWGECDSETSSNSQPRFGFQLWGSKRINPAMLQRPTEISQRVYVHVCEKGVCHLLEGAYKVIVQHSAQILHWAALAHIFLRHISKTHNPSAMKNNEIMPLSASLVPFTKPNATSVSFPVSSAVTSGPAKMSKKGLEWLNQKVLSHRPNDLHHYLCKS